MRRSDFERHARKFWGDAFRSAGKQTRPGDADVERLVEVTVGLAYSEKLLDQEPRK